MFSHCQLVVMMLALRLAQVQAVIGGHESVPHSRPYMVFLKRSVHGTGETYCAGFLLNEDFVISAAYCQADSYTALLGLHDIHNSHEIQQISVDETFVHELYDSAVYKHDIMLLKLSSKAKFSENVKPIRLACRDSISLPKSCVVPGWGETNINSKYLSLKLMEANVTLVSNSECPLENSYCSEGETGPAKGDGGGPLVCDGKAYGVVSSIFTPKSGGPLIHRYTKIPDKRDWITSTICNALF